MIAFSCSGCGKRLEVNEALAGKQSACPKCGQPVEVPLPTCADAAREQRETVSFVPTSSAGEGVQKRYDFLAPPEGPDELGRLGPYRVLTELGAGGMGVVFKAEHKILRRLVALKVIRKEHLSSPGAIDRFHREIRAIARLSHPNVILAHDADRIGDTHFFTMEYVEGTDLARLVKERGPLPMAAACEYIRQAALGLQHAFERGLVHRDIKPSNLIRTARGDVVKVLDLGLARLGSSGDGDASSAVTPDGAIMGTPDYLAPEQCLDAHNVDIRSDLYSLGCTFYFLLTGRVPFPGGSFGEKIARHLTREAVPVEQLRPEIPPALAALVCKLMAKRPEERYQTPAELVKALRDMTLGTLGKTEFTHTVPQTPTPPGTAALERKTSPSPARRMRLWWAVGAVALLLLACVGSAIGWRFIGSRIPPSPVAVVPPTLSAAAVLPPTLPAVAGVAVRKEDNGTFEVRTAQYVAEIGADGCLNSLRAGGVEFLKPGEPLCNGKSVARGAYFYSAKDGHLGAVKMADVRQTAANVITARGQRFDVRYEFTPDGFTLAARNSTDDVAPFYINLDSASITDVVNGKGERLAVPTALSWLAPTDAKWETTTWIAGRPRLKIVCKDAGGTKIWGPFGQAKSQAWQADVGSYQTAEVRLEPSVAEEDEKPVAPADLVLYAPLDYQVFQRKTRARGAIAVRGRVRSAFDRLEARLTGKPLEGTLPEQWQAVATAAGAKTFDATLPAPAGGWYKLEVRALKDGKEVARAAVEHVGVGEVFVGAGQSNSTNCGEFKTQQTSNMVSTFSGSDWRLADDPQPGSRDEGQPGCAGGSFWPAFGDAMYEKYKVPIGVAVTGHSGTSINAWQPGGELFRWTTGRMDQLGREGFRAVLWHQGESDTTMPSDEYGKKLTALIEESRKATGWDVPWFVAQVSYHNPKDIMTASTREAQKKLWDSGVALEGPDTDTLTGDNRDLMGMGIHFSPKGLRAHSRLWADKVGVWLDKVLAK